MMGSARVAGAGVYSCWSMEAGAPLWPDRHVWAPTFLPERQIVEPGLDSTADTAGAVAIISHWCMEAGAQFGHAAPPNLIA